MKGYSFPYSKIGAFYRPIIPVTIKYNKRIVDYLALVDSGADFNLFHADIAGFLGIDLTKLKKMQFSGVKSSALGEAAYTAIEIGVRNIFISVPVMFSRDISDKGYGIVGQIGFFDHFEISFHYSKKTVEIK